MSSLSDLSEEIRKAVIDGKSSVRGLTVSVRRKNSMSSTKWAEDFLSSYDRGDAAKAMEALASGILGNNTEPSYPEIDLSKAQKGSVLVLRNGKYVKLVGRKDQPDVKGWEYEADNGIVYRAEGTEYNGYDSKNDVMVVISGGKVVAKR